MAKILINSFLFFVRNDMLSRKLAIAKFAAFTNRGMLDEMYYILWRIDKEKKKYIWLHTINQYGDTTLNHLQIPYVKAELEELRSENIVQDIKKLIDDVLNFITSIDTHKYIKFVGD